MRAAVAAGGGNRSRTSVVEEEEEAGCSMGMGMMKGGAVASTSASSKTPLPQIPTRPLFPRWTAPSHWLFLHWVSLSCLLSPASPLLNHLKDAK